MEEWLMEKRFTTNGYYIYDHFKENEWLVNEVEVEYIVSLMNNLDTKARERSKALSKLQKENEQLKHDATVLIQANQDYRKENEQLKDALNQRTEQCDKYYEENEQLKKEIEELENKNEILEGKLWNCQNVR